MTRLMPQGDDDAANVAEFGEHQFACVGDIVGIADTENLATTVKVADGCGVFRSRRDPGGRMPLGGGSALPLHRISPVRFLVAVHRKQFQVVEKYREGDTRMPAGSERPAKPCYSAILSFGMIENTRLTCASYS